MEKPTVIAALRRFLGPWQRTEPKLTREQRRAIRAINECRTIAMGGDVYFCDECQEKRFAFHSCNHKACPQCGAAATAAWVERELGKRVAAPYYMITFTVPSELRELFFGPRAKEAYDAFFAAASTALSQQLERKKWLGASKSGFTMVLHTWNQRLLPHFHIHSIVPACGLDERGNYVEQLDPDKFVPIFKALKPALRSLMGSELEARGLGCDPSVWQKEWSVNVKAFGSGENAIKYLGRYTSRSVIGNSRIVRITDEEVTYRWKDRKTGEQHEDTLSGIEFVRRYMRHVLPAKLRSIRYYGFCHPAAKKDRAKVTLLSGRAYELNELQSRKEKEREPSEDEAWEIELEALIRELKGKQRDCPCCGTRLRLVETICSPWEMKRKPKSRAPPATTEAENVTNPEQPNP